jgi:abortive infection bacteriophage resistance protein
MSTLYNKPFRDPSGHLSHQVSKGLIVNNNTSAQKILEQIGYHRIKIYLFPFYTNNSRSSYTPGASFEKAVELYRFDEALRQFLFSLIARIEVKLRTRLDQKISDHVNDPFWYLNDRYFLNSKLPDIQRFRSSLQQEFMRARDEYAMYYKNNYHSPCSSYSSMPPFWAAIEKTTFGSLLKLMSLLDKSEFGPRASNILDSLASEFGARNFGELNKWMVVIKEIRNRCAHHSRLWNTVVREPSNISSRLMYTSSHSNRIYLSFALLKVMTENLGIVIDLRSEINDLLNKYPTVINHTNAMGFPLNWYQDPLWQ